MTANWTPGHWHVEQSGRTISVQTNENMWIAELWLNHASNEDRLAAARLLAAASDMAEALAQIAKGEGPYAQDPLTHAANVIEAMKDLARAALTKLEG